MQSFSHRALDVIASAPGLKQRQGQRDMLSLLAQILERSRPECCAGVEAGTGTGKSLAYLIPTALWAVETGRRVVVATGTKNLQDQLIKKDAPFVQDLIFQATGQKVSAAVLFGKNNYLCPVVLNRHLTRRWDEANAFLAVGAVPRQREQEELCFLDMLARWLDNGGSGLRDHLPAWPYLPGTQENRDYWWNRVSAADDSADCSRCTNKTACRFQAAREAAAASQVVIANHHLVLMDVLLRRKTGGLSLFAAKKGRPPEVLVVDEAHDFLEAAKDALEAVFSRRRVARLRNDVFDFLEEIYAWVSQTRLCEEAYVGEKIYDARQHDAKHWFLLTQKLENLFTWGQKHLAGGDRRSLLPGHLPPVEGILDGLWRYFSPVTGLLSYVSRVVEAVGAAVEGNREMKKEFEPFEQRADRLRERWEELIEAFRRAVLLENHYRLKGRTGDVCMVEKDRFVTHPADPAPFLRGLWKAYDHVFLTSATLFPFPQSEGFQWFRERYGFTEGEIALGVVRSPFRYEEQMQAFILTDPELTPPDGKPDDNDDKNKKQYARRVEALSRAVLRATERSLGGVLVLFTSYREMRDVADLMRDKLPPDRLLLVQGEAGKAELLVRFREHGRAILFGVASFWQGVDVPGDALSCLLVAKLPFPTPDDPDVEAECWLAGREWWIKVYLPRASLTLRQGVGRLIRTETDHGIAVIADPRGASKHKRMVRNCLPVNLKEVRLA